MTFQCWEYGISLCRELAFQYETLYDYQSLSWIRVSKVLFLLLLSNKHPLGCCKVRFSTPSVIPILLCSMRTIWHQTQCLNYLRTPTLIRKCRDSVMGVISSLVIVTVLHIFHSVTENGGSIL